MFCEAAQALMVALENFLPGKNVFFFARIMIIGVI